MDRDCPRGRPRASGLTRRGLIGTPSEGTASSPTLRTPCVAEPGPLRFCGATTCVHDRVLDAWPDGTPHSNTRPVRGRGHGEAHSSPGGRRAFASVGFCCVTTGVETARCRGNPSGEVLGCGPRLAVGASAAAGDVLRRRASAGLRPGRGVSAAVWPPASGAPSADTQGRGSTAGSTGGLDTGSRTLCGGKSAIPGVSRWRSRPLGWYAEHVPWSLRLRGAARGGWLRSSSGTSPSCFGPTRVDLRESDPPECSSRSIPRGWGKAKEDMLTAGRAGRQAARRKQGRRRTRDALGLKDTQEGTTPLKQDREEHARRKRGEGVRPKKAVFL